MIKNKILNIKIIFKIYLKTLKISLKHFKFSNRFLYYINQKIIFKNYFLKLFLIIVTKQGSSLHSIFFFFSQKKKKSGSPLRLRYIF